MTIRRPVPVLIVGIALLSACAAPTAPPPASTPETPSDATPPAKASPSDIGEGPVVLQDGNNLLRTQLRPKRSPELEDNRIGIHAHALWNPEGQGVFPSGGLDAGYILKLGTKHARLAIKSLDAPDDPDILIDVASDEPESSIDGVLSLLDYSYCTLQIDQESGVKNCSRGGQELFNTAEHIHLLRGVHSIRVPPLPSAANAGSNLNANNMAALEEKKPYCWRAYVPDILLI